MKSLVFLASFLFGGLISGCTGGMGPGGNLAGPGAGENPGGPGGPLSSPPTGPTAAATPGQQPTEWGTVGATPPLLLIQVSSPDGTVDLSTDILSKFKNFEPIDDSHCKTKAGDSAPQIFPEDKPTIYTSSSIPPVSSSWSTNACGQIVINCLIADPKEGKNVMEIHAGFVDNGSIYESDTAKIECVKNDYPPLVLTLKPSFSNTSAPIPNNR